MSLVFDHFPDGGSAMSTMLALADWANDAGGNCYPSIDKIATKTRVTNSQAKRNVHRLIEQGYIEVVGNATGGYHKVASRRYQFVLSKLTGSTDATGSVSATGSIDARDGVHGCAETGCMGATQYISEPSVIHQGVHAPSKKPKSARKAKTSIPADFKISEAVAAWAASKGYNHLDDHLEHFKLKSEARGYTYLNWDAALKTAIRDDWAGQNKQGISAKRPPATTDFAQTNYGTGGAF